MASFTLTSDRFPAGTTVSVYALTTSPKKLNGAPPGSVVTTGTVTDSTVTFTGLNPDTRYIAYASSNGAYAFFSTYTHVPPAQQATETETTLGSAATVIRATGLDDTATVQAALNNGAATIVLVNDGVQYNIGAISLTTSASRRIVGFGRPIINQTASTLFTFRGGYDDLGAISSLAVAAVNLQDPGESTSSGTTRVTQLTLASAATITKGDQLQVVSDDLIVTARDNADASNNRFQGEYSLAGAASTGTTVTLAHQLTETYTTNARLARVKNVSFSIDGCIFDVDSSIRGSSAYGSTIMLKAARHCRVNDCEFSHSVSRGIVNYTVGASFTNIVMRDLLDRPSLSQYGYGIQDGGQFTRVTNVVGSNLRHLYTTDAQVTPAGSSFFEQYGGARYCIVTASTGYNCQHSPFDTHGDSYAIQFSNCKAVGSFKGADSGAVGFTARGRRHKFSGCEAHGCYTGFRITAGGTRVEQCSSYRTRDQQGLQVSGDTDDAINVTTLEKIVVQGGFYETDSSTCFNGIAVGVSGQTYVLDVEVNDVTVSGLVTPSAWRALNIPQANTTCVVRNLKVNGDAATPAGSGTAILVGGDATTKVRARGLQVRTGAVAWSGFTLVGVSGGGTAADVEVLDIDADGDAAAPFATPINATFTNARGSWRTRRNTTYSASDFIGVAASASLVLDTAKRTDRHLTVRLTGTAGALSIAALPTPLSSFPGQRLTIRNDSNGTVTIPTPSTTVAAAAAASFVWDGTNWRQVT